MEIPDGFLSRSSGRIRRPQPRLNEDKQTAKEETKERAGMSDKLLAGMRGVRGVSSRAGRKTRTRLITIRQARINLSSRLRMLQRVGDHSVSLSR